MSSFRVLGMLSVVCGCITAAAILMNTKARASGGHDIRGAWVVALVCWVLGAGLVAHRKWAAVLFATILGLCGAVVAVGSVGKVPMPWLIMNFVFGVVLLLPALITVRDWHLLRNKWIT